MTSFRKASEITFSRWNLTRKYGQSSSRIYGLQRGSACSGVTCTRVGAITRGIVQADLGPVTHIICARGSDASVLHVYQISSLDPGFISLAERNLAFSLFAYVSHPKSTFIFWDSLTHPIKIFLSSYWHCYRIGFDEIVQIIRIGMKKKLSTGIPLINKNYTNENLYEDNKKEKTKREHEHNYKCVNICDIIMSLWGKTTKRTRKY